MSEQTETQDGGGGVAQASDTLSVTDNRTGKTLRDRDHRRHGPRDGLPPDQGRRRRLRPDDLRPGVHEHRVVPVARSRSSTATRASSSTAATRSSSSPRSRTYLEVAYLLDQRRAADASSSSTTGSHEITIHTFVHENVKKFMQGFRYDAHPMGMLLGSVGALSTFYPDANEIQDPDNRTIQTIRLIAKMPTLAAFAYRHIDGPALRLSRQRPRPTPGNFLGDDVQDDRAEVRARSAARAGARRPLHPARRPRAELLDQRGARRRLARRSTRTRRVAAGVAALYGPLHGGANEAVLRMLTRIEQQREHPRLHRGREGRRRAPDGLRPPRLQELRPARQDHQEGRRRRLRGHGQEPAARHRHSSSRRSRSRTSTSSSASSTRTSTSTRA